MPLQEVSLGLLPFIGPLAAKAIGYLIPNQRLDRVVEFLRNLEAEVSRLGIGHPENFKKNMTRSDGLDLSGGRTDSSRPFGFPERKERLARLVR